MAREPQAQDVKERERVSVSVRMHWLFRIPLRWRDLQIEMIAIVKWFKILLNGSTNYAFFWYSNTQSVFTHLHWDAQSEIELQWRWTIIVIVELHFQFMIYGKMLAIRAVLISNRWK